MGGGGVGGLFEGRVDSPFLIKGDVIGLGGL